ncbi:MAG: hypothetical protein ACPGRX_01780 [Bdellovibrionales bacterium]
MKDLFFKRKCLPFAAAILLSSAVYFAPNFAFAGKKVYSPYVSAGEVELEYKGEYKIDDDNSVDGAWEQTIGAGYGVSDFLFVEGAIEFEDEPDKDVETKALEFEAKFQLTEQGQYFLDAGALVEYKYSLAGDADKIEGKALLAKEIGPTSNYANFIIEREVGEDSSDREEYGLAWKTKYHYSKAFDPGFEYYADFGDTTEDYSGQTHRIGPTAYGDLGPFEYDAGVLFGISRAAPDATLKLNLEYEF